MTCHGYPTEGHRAHHIVEDASIVSYQRAQAESLRALRQATGNVQADIATALRMK